MKEMIIGVVGLGKMGSAFARKLVAEGYSVFVWDRSPERAAEIASATHYTSLNSLLATVDIAIVSLWGDDVARKVTLAQILPAMQPSQLLIEMSTLSPQMYETLESAAQEHNVPFVAAPVLGNPDAVRAGSLTVLPGGAKELVQRARPILASLGNVIEMPSVRASGYLKLANNTVLGVVAETLGELFELCDAAGIDRNVSVPSLVGALQRIAQQKGPQLLAGDTEPRFALSALLKDLHLANQAAQSLKVSIPLLDTVIPEAERVVENGLGDRDYIVLTLARTEPAVSHA
jgi:3-hydroxyisobutyrate dehydrogenase-like beta-hydroxyacid dehydrogenase